MRNAIEAFFLLPRLYFELIVQPGFLGGLQFVPAFGTACLAVGLGLSAKFPHKGLLAFLLPAFGSSLLVGALELGARSLVSDIREPLIWGFLVSHLALTGYLVFHLREAWQPATAFGLFSLTYVPFTTVVAMLDNTSFR